MKRRLSVTTSKSPTSVQPNPSEVWLVLGPRGEWAM
jgi:hypothetical protein